MSETEHDWAAQEKERRSKFSWGQRRLEDGKVMGFTLYHVGGVLFILAAIAIPWAVGVQEIYERIMR